MPYDFTYMWNVKKEIKQNRNKFIDTENTLMVARGERCGESGEKHEGIKKKIKGLVTEWSQSVKYSTGSRVSSIVMTVCGARWVLDSQGVTM